MTASGGPWRLLEIANGYREAKVLLAAHELGVFTALADAPRHGDTLARDLGTSPEGTRDLLHALVGLDVLVRDDAGRYAATPDASRYLTPDGPAYIGGFLRFLDRSLHPAWDRLTERLREDADPARHADPYPGVYADPVERDTFLDAMDVLNSAQSATLAQLDWSPYTTVADIGGARGNVAAALVRAHPNLHATVFDLPPLAGPFARHMDRLGLNDRIRFTAGDFFTDPLPEADALIFGHVLHNWPPPARSELLAKAHTAVRPGGLVVVYDAMLDEDTPRLGNALVSLDMLVWSRGGAEYTYEECRRTLEDAGFADVVRRPLGASSSVVTARKADT